MLLDYNFGIKTIFLNKLGFLAHNIANIIYPAQCYICNEILLDEDGICPKCFNSINFIDEPMCDIMGIPFAYDPGEGILSAEALADIHHFYKLRAVCHYDDNAMKLVQLLKYHDRLQVSRLMSKMMQRAGQQLLNDSDLLIPVPLFFMRLWRRKYNQSLLLAKELSKLSGIELNHQILRRIKNTISQVGLSATERRSNVAGAFKINDKMKSEIKDRNILLIDDVYTTGATSNACAKILLKNGASKVNILVFARVVYPLKLTI